MNSDFSNSATCSNNSLEDKSKCEKMFILVQISLVVNTRIKLLVPSSYIPEKQKKQEMEFQHNKNHTY